MANNNNVPGGTFMGLSGEQILRILFEEFSRSGFKFDNFNTMIPSVLNRVMMQNGGMAGNYLTEMLFKGMMGNFTKK